MDLTGYVLRTSLMLVIMLLCFVAWCLIPAPRTTAYRFFGALTIIGFAVEMTGMVMLLQGRSPLYVYNAYAIIELVCIVVVVSSIQRKLKLIATLFGAAGLLGFLVNAWVDGGAGPLLFEGVLTASVLQALLILVTLWRLAMTSEMPLQKVPEFWLFMGLLVYFGGMAPFIALIRFVYANDRVVASVLWTLMPILCSIRYAMGAWSCLLKRREALRPAHG